jgi:hypothetical protein
LLRLDPAVAQFVQPSIETSEPCGKRSLLRRSIAISIVAVSRALSHAPKTRNAAVKWKLRPPPSKAARTILTAPTQVKPSKDCVSVIYVIDLNKDITSFSGAMHRVTPQRSSLRDDHSIVGRVGALAAIASRTFYLRFFGRHAACCAVRP